ncbi:MAG TPA: hypothetical protein VMI31_02055 [Fimbriimonadaceae bacterium]|nr:hypothetical protein [Fimbriimonadaceae bacterium]
MVRIAGSNVRKPAEPTLRTIPDERVLDSDRPRIRSDLPAGKGVELIAVGIGARLGLADAMGPTGDTDGRDKPKRTGVVRRNGLRPPIAWAIGRQPVSARVDIVFPELAVSQENETAAVQVDDVRAATLSA